MSACRSACHRNNFRKSRVGRVGEDHREDVRVGVGVGVVEFQLNRTEPHVVSLQDRCEVPRHQRVWTSETAAMTVGVRGAER